MRTPCASTVIRQFGQEALGLDHHQPMNGERRALPRSSASWVRKPWASIIKPMNENAVRFHGCHLGLGTRAVLAIVLGKEEESLQVRPASLRTSGCARGPSAQLPLFCRCRTQLHRTFQGYATNGGQQEMDVIGHNKKFVQKVTLLFAVSEHGFT